MREAWRISHTYTRCGIYTNTDIHTQHLCSFHNACQIQIGLWCKKMIKTCLPAQHSKYPCQKHHLADTWAGVEVMTPLPNTHKHTTITVHRNTQTTGQQQKEEEWIRDETVRGDMR